MTTRSAPAPSQSDTVDTAERLRVVLGRLGRYLRLTHVDGDLSPSQREVLFSISRHGSLRFSELAAEEGLNPTMLSRIVAKLEAAKLVTRRPDDDDARVVHLGPTARGRGLCDEMRHERTNALRHALEELTDAERRALVNVMPALESLVETLRRRDR